jgi:hypothetical protein
MPVPPIRRDVRVASRAPVVAVPSQVTLTLLGGDPTPTTRIVLQLSNREAIAYCPEHPCSAVVVNVRPGASPPPWTPGFVERRVTVQPRDRSGLPPAVLLRGTGTDTVTTVELILPDAQAAAAYVAGDEYLVIVAPTH